MCSWKGCIRIRGRRLRVTVRSTSTPTDQTVMRGSATAPPGRRTMRCECGVRGDGSVRVAGVV